MTEPIAMSDLIANLSSAAAAQGIAVQRDSAMILRGTKEAIRAKWFLGGNKSVYSFSCRLDQATHTATFREMIADRSWGIAPPSFKVESYSQSGTTVTSKQREAAVGGGGSQELGPWRKACTTVVEKSGWSFRYEPAAAP